MIEGMISLEWRKQQDKYFQTMGITKSVTTWSARVIVHLWDLVYVVWQHRNSVLHKTPMVELLGGAYALDQALHLEWRLGFERMPAIVRASIPDSILTVMEGTLWDRKSWFVLVRRAREQMQGYIPLDDFSKKDGSLRGWVGL